MPYTSYKFRKSEQKNKKTDHSPDSAIILNSPLNIDMAALSSNIEKQLSQHSSERLNRGRMFKNRSQSIFQMKSNERKKRKKSKSHQLIEKQEEEYQNNDLFQFPSVLNQNMPQNSGESDLEDISDNNQRSQKQEKVREVKKDD